MAKRSDKQYSILIVSSSEQFNTVARKVLPNGKFNVVETKKSISAAKREMITRPYDLILVNAPLTDGFGTQFVMEVRERRSMGIIIAVPGEVYGDISDKLADQGIIAIAKPIVTKNLEVQIRLLLAMLENVKEAERKVTRIEEKMEEVLDSGFVAFQMARALINDTDFINKLQRGEVTRSECKHSNYCIGRMYTLDMKCHHCVDEDLPRKIQREIKKAGRKG